MKSTSLPAAHPLPRTVPTEAVHTMADKPTWDAKMPPAGTCAQPRGAMICPRQDSLRTSGQVPGESVFRLPPNTQWSCQHHSDWTGPQQAMGRQAQADSSILPYSHKMPDSTDVRVPRFSHCEQFLPRKDRLLIEFGLFLQGSSESCLPTRQRTMKRGAPTPTRSLSVSASV